MKRTETKRRRGFSSLIACSSSAVLGWDKWDCVNEDNHQGTYTDYSLGKPYVTLIVEAKKEDVYFSIPAGFDGLFYPLERFRKEAPDIFKAVEQATPGLITGASG